MWKKLDKRVIACWMYSFYFNVIPNLMPDEIESWKKQLLKKFTMKKVTYFETNE